MHEYYAPGSFPVSVSNDLVHWRGIGAVFAAGHSPWWALPAPIGRYWGPTLYRIGSRWVVHFAAQYNAAAHLEHFPDGEPIQAGRWCSGSRARFDPGAVDDEAAPLQGSVQQTEAASRTYGGVIDPSIISNPLTGQRYLFWAEEHSSIWAARLSRDGLTLSSDIHLALSTQNGWRVRDVKPAVRDRGARGDLSRRLVLPVLQRRVGVERQLRGRRRDRARSARP